MKRDHLLGKPVVMNGEEYKTVEHAFRALKAQQSRQKKRKIDTAATTDTATPPPQTPALTQKQRNASRQWKTKWAYKREETDKYAPRPEVSANYRAWYRVGNGKTETSDAAFCDTCIKHGKKNSFTAISGNVKSHTEQCLDDHEMSSDHTHAVREEALFDASLRDTVLKDSIEKAFSTQEHLHIEQIKRKLRSALVIGTEDIPVVKAEALNALCDQNGADMGSERYRNSCAATDFISVLAAELQGDLLDDIRESPFTSLLIDESTDCGDMQHLILYFMYLRDGEVKTQFVELIFIPPAGGTGAEALCGLLSSFFSDNGIDPSLVCAFCSDGASVMTGCTSGVATRLKAIFNPFLVAIHCVAHKLALASNDAMDCDDGFTAWERTLSDTFSFYSRSPKRSGRLKDICDQCDLVWRTLQHPAKTRWLSRSGSCNSVLNSLEAIFEHLHEESSGDESSTAGNLYTRLCSFKWVFLLHFMADILNTLAALSRVFQTDGLLNHEVVSYVEATIAGLRASYLVDTPLFGCGRLSTFLEEGKRQTDPSETLLFWGHFKSYGVDFLVTPEEFDWCVSLTKKFTATLVDGLATRFPNMQVYSAFDCFNPEPLRDCDEMPAAFGEEDLNVLIEHFG